MLDFISKKCYNNPVEINAGGVPVMENKNEFDYVFKACAGKVHPAAITDLLSVPEFTEALRKFEGSMDNQTLYALADKVRVEFYANITDERFKKEYISTYGVEAWRIWKRRYRLLANGSRKAQRALDT